MTERKFDPTGIIIRDKTDASKQIQLHIDHEKGSVGIVYNKGLEMIIIHTSIAKDVPLHVKEEE
jgi:putative NIF3 family GTP cyclohydrolase 1 type 2